MSGIEDFNNLVDSPPNSVNKKMEKAHLRHVSQGYEINMQNHNFNLGQHNQEENNLNVELKTMNYNHFKKG